MKWISRTFVVSVVANQDVAVQNWWHFFSHPASNVHGTCKLPVSHHRTISSSPMSWLSKNLSVALLEYYASLKLGGFYKKIMFFLIFCYKINSEASFYALSVCKTVYENTKLATVRVALICATKPRLSVLMMYLSYKVSWMCMYKESELYLWVLRQSWTPFLS